MRQHHVLRYRQRSARQTGEACARSIAIATSAVAASKLRRVVQHNADRSHRRPPVAGLRHACLDPFVANGACEVSDAAIGLIGCHRDPGTAQCVQPKRQGVIRVAGPIAPAAAARQQRAARRRKSDASPGSLVRRKDRVPAPSARSAGGTTLHVVQLAPLLQSRSMVPCGRPCRGSAAPARVHPVTQEPGSASRRSSIVRARLAPVAAAAATFLPPLVRHRHLATEPPATPGHATGACRTSRPQRWGNHIDRPPHPRPSRL